MDGPTQFIEIPGYAEALRRESDLRRKAWSADSEEIAGVRVRLLTFRDMEMLASMRNGFFCPWKFETDTEFLGHCAQLVWWLSDCAKPRRGGGFVSNIIVAAQVQRLTKHLGQHGKQLAEEVNAYLRDTFMDSPKGGGSSGAAPIASGPAYVADLLASAGYRMTLDEILDTPLIRLWQIMRLAQRRVTGDTPTNESDRIATDYLASLAKN